VGKIEWRWSGISTWNGTSYTGTMSSQAGPTGYAPTDDFPTWEHGVPEVLNKWQQTPP
jgi:hypothetical protein